MVSSVRNQILLMLCQQRQLVPEPLLQAASASCDDDTPLESALAQHGAPPSVQHTLLAELHRLLGQHQGDEQACLAALAEAIELDPLKTLPASAVAALGSPAAAKPGDAAGGDGIGKGSTSRDAAGPTSRDAAGNAAGNASGNAADNAAGNHGGAPRFRPLKLLARGGLGEVRLAWDEQLGREVALKQIQSQLAADPDSRTRFRREAEITGRLEHPGIVPVYGYGHAAGQPFYAMRLIRGESLQQAIRTLHTSAAPDAKIEQPPAPLTQRREFRQLLGRLIDVCQAVAYAHHRGVVHRDLKPANIMLGPFGETLVVDWGLAAAQREGGGSGSGGGELGSEGGSEGEGVAEGRALAPMAQPHALASVATEGVATEGVAAEGRALAPMAQPHALASVATDGVATDGVATKSAAGDDTFNPAIPPLGPVVADAALTAVGDPVGTPVYMSPEQARGQAITAASDIYGLGATLYALLTNQPPVADSDYANVIRRVLAGDIQAPRSVRHDIPLPLDAVCRKAIATQPADRYATPLELAADLQRWLDDEPVSACPEPWTERARRWTRKHRTATVSTAATLLVALVGAVVASVLFGAINRKLNKSNTELSESVTRETEANQLVRQQQAKLQSSLDASTLRLAHRELQRNRLEEAEKLLDTIDSDARGWEWGYLKRMLHGHLRELPGHESATCVAFSPDDGVLVTGDFAGDLRAFDASTGTLLWKQSLPHPVTAVAVDPRGARCAASTNDPTVFPQVNGSLTLHDLATGETVKTLEGHTAGVHDLAYHPRQAQLVSAANDGSVRLWDAESGESIRSWELIPESRNVRAVLAVDISVDGLIAAGTVSGRVHLWPADSEELQDEFPIASSNINDLAFGEFGDRLAVSVDNLAWVWDVVRREAAFKIAAKIDNVTKVALAAQDTLLIGLGEDGQINLWNLAENGSVLREIRAHSRTGVGLALDSSRTFLATAGGQVRVWQMLAEPDNIELPRAPSMQQFGRIRFSHDGLRLAVIGIQSYLAQPDEMQHVPLQGYVLPATNVDWSRDGRFVATSGFDRLVRVHSALDGSLLHSMSGHGYDAEKTGLATDVAFHPDSRRVASAGWDATVRVWDAEKGVELHVLRKSEGPVTAVAFSDDGLLLAGGKDGQLWIWDIDADAPADSEPERLGEHDSVLNIRFSRDGRLVATSGFDGSVKLWNWAERTVYRTFQAQTQWTTGVAISPDGDRLVSSSQDGTLMLWNVESEELLLSLNFGAAPVGVDFDRAGQRLAVVFQDGVVRVFDGRPLSSEVLLALREAQAWTGRRQMLSNDEIHRQLADSKFLSPDARAIAQRILTAAPAQPTGQVAAQAAARRSFSLNEQAFRVAGDPDRNPVVYRWALETARTAVALMPEQGSVVNTLGVCLYRAGEYAEAKEVLERSLKMNRVSAGLLRRIADPTDSAFLALTLWQLGERDEALKHLANAQEARREGSWRQRVDYYDFVREAERVVAQP